MVEEVQVCPDCGDAIEDSEAFYNCNSCGNEFPASAIADLNRFQAIVKLLEDGSNRVPFRAKMLPPLENRVGRKDKLIARSRERFAMKRATIEEKLNRWMKGSVD